jgi:segregation and condensation protein B
MSENIELSENIETKGEAEAAEEATPAREVIFEEALEAILFAAGHPVTYATLARVFELTPAVVRDKVKEYSQLYNAESELKRGVILLTYQDSCQLCTKKMYLTEIRDALGIRKSGSLSTAAMETLAVVAYNQPVTRVFVDTIRKVDSSYAMNSLIDRGLIECVGRLDVPGRPMQYGTTSDFLRCFGLHSISELPTASDELIGLFRKAEDKLTVADEEAQMSIQDVDGEVIPSSEQIADSDNRATGNEAVADGTAEEEVSIFDSDEDGTSAEDDIISFD